MPAFLCDYLNEIVILSDGSLTTCCLDPLAVNVFGNIYEDALSLIQKRYLAIREKIVQDVYYMPRCRICYDKIMAAGFPPTGTYKADPTDVEVAAFLGNGPEVVNRMVIELTSLCNLKCNGCMQSRFDFTLYRKKNRLDISRLIAWLSSGILALKNIRLFNYGETFLHPQAIDFCSAVNAKNSKLNIEIATNGMLLNTSQKRRRILFSGVNSLLFSIHGSSQETTQIYMTRRFNFEKMLMILRELVSVKNTYELKTPRLIWKFLLFSWNDSDEEIKRAIALTRQIGLDGIIFETVGFPSPSLRFTPGSDALKQLQNRQDKK